jgi:hypothetical protein
MLNAVLLTCVVTELHKPSSPGLEPRTDFRGSFFCSYNAPAETNNFGLGTVCCIVLGFYAKETIFTGTRNQDRFFGVAAFVPIIS